MERIRLPHMKNIRLRKPTEPNSKKSETSNEQENIICLKKCVSSLLKDLKERQVDRRICPEMNRAFEIEGSDNIAIIEIENNKLDIRVKKPYSDYTYNNFAIREGEDEIREYLESIIDETKSDSEKSGINELMECITTLSNQLDQHFNNL